MNLKKALLEESNSIVLYRIYKRNMFNLSEKCFYCAPHKGCNKSSWRQERSWKKYRKTQWK